MRRNIAYTLVAFLLLGYTGLGQNTNWSTTQYIGIGTTNPLDKLHVHDGGIRFSSSGNDGVTLSTLNAYGYNYYSVTANTPGNGIVSLFNPSNTATGNQYVFQFNTTRGSALMLAGVDADRQHVISTTNDITNGHPWDLVFRAVPDNVNWNTSAYNSLVVKAGAPSNMLYLSSSGNIGIGTTTPAEKLSVNGTIKTKKVTVTLNNWPDYVFLPSYKLPSLKKIEAYIKQNKHLPGIPSAQQVETEGLDLGSNQAALLKKIEELTLYVLQQSKKLEGQQNRLRVLEAKLSRNKRIFK